MISAAKLLLLYLFFHLLVGFNYSSWNFTQWTENLKYLDSGWYLHLATNGYVTPIDSLNSPNIQYAFFPLWPMVLRSLGILAPESYLQVFGAVLSFILFSFTICMIRFGTKGPAEPSHGNATNLIFSNRSITLFPMVFAPGAWIYFSNHTESLFLFLSVSAWHFAQKRKLVTSSIFAGLASLTRNQGVLVAMCLGIFFFIGNNKETIANRLKNFAVYGIISGGLYCCWLAFMYINTDSIMTSMDAQKYWHITTSLTKYFTNLFWLSSKNAPRAFWFWAIFICSIAILCKKSNHTPLGISIGLYILTSVLLWPLQGNNFSQAYRFGAVLFPFWLVIGHKLTRLLDSPVKNKRNLARGVLLILFLNSIRTSAFYYLKPNWPY